MNSETIMFGKYEGENIINVSNKDINYMLYCINKGLVVFDGCGDLVNDVYSEIETREKMEWFLKHRGNTLRLKTPTHLKLERIFKKEIRKSNKSKVYFIKDESNRYKIGKAEQPTKRLVELQVGNCDKLTLVFEVPGSYKFEGLIHDLLKKYRIRGEWYKNCELLHTILNVLGYKEV